MPLEVETIEYRAYHQGDEPAILQLMRESGYPHDERFWRWINRECPHGQAIVELAILNDEVIGHYSVLPRLLSFRGIMVKAGLAIHAVVHPEHRGLAVLQHLMERILERCRQMGLPFIYAFPNEQIWLVYLKIFQWQPMGDLTALELSLESPISRRDPQGIEFREGKRFERRHGELSAGGGLEPHVRVAKDSEYLNWRYVSHPRAHYQLLEAHIKPQGLLGFLVLKLYEKQGRRYGHLIDMGLDPSAPAGLFRELVYQALLSFQARQVQVASCWIQEGTPLFDTLQEMGFQATGSTTPLGFRPIGPNRWTEGLRWDRWHIMMGDSDAF